MSQAYLADELNEAGIPWTVQITAGQAEFDRIRALSVAPATTWADKAARSRRVNTARKHHKLAVELAQLIRAGETTETARLRLDIGAVTAKTIRGLAIRLGLLRPYQRTRHIVVARK